MLAGAALLFAPLQLAYGAEKIAPAQYPPVFGDNLPPAPVATTPAKTPTPVAIPLPPPITLPKVIAPAQVVTVIQNQPPAAPSVPIAANAASQVTVNGKFVTVNVAPLATPPQGTVAVAVTGDGFTFTLGTTSTDGGNATAGSVTMIDGQLALNTAQRTNLTTSGSGFKPNDQVAVFVFSTATFLGNVKTSGVGEFNASIKLPDLPLGPHHLQATGVTADGKSRTINLLLNVTAPVAPAKSLKSSKALVFILTFLLILLAVLLLFWRVYAMRKKKKEKALESNGQVSKTVKLEVDVDDIDSLIEGLIQRFSNGDSGGNQWEDYGLRVRPIRAF